MDEVYIALLLVAITFCIVLYTRLGNKRKLAESLIRENRKLIADNALLQTEQLKFQLQPHTLNNILANLKSIADRLNKGMGALSETLEYILYKGKAHLVSVEDELNFIQKYLALNDLFVTEINSIKINVSNVNRSSLYYRVACVPHLVCAYFLENAFKHGDVHHPEFLQVNLVLSESHFELIVINKIKPLRRESYGGIGLNNMKQRMELLMQGKYNITTQASGQDYCSRLTIHF